MGNVSIGFSTDPNSWVSKIIRWFTGSKYSHTFLMWESTDFGRMIIESDSGGVQFCTLKHFDTKTNPILYAYSPMVDLLPAVKVAVEEYLGDAYDYDGLFGMAWVMLWRKLKRRVRNPLHKKNALFCSAFVTRVLQIANDLAAKAGQPAPYPGAEKLTPWDTNAQDVADFLQGAKLVT